MTTENKPIQIKPPTKTVVQSARYFFREEDTSPVVEYDAAPTHKDLVDVPFRELTFDPKVEHTTESALQLAVSAEQTLIGQIVSNGPFTRPGVMDAIDQAIRTEGLEQRDTLQSELKEILIRKLDSILVQKHWGENFKKVAGVITGFYNSATGGGFEVNRLINTYELNPDPETGPTLNLLALMEAISYAQARLVNEHGLTIRELFRKRSESIADKLAILRGFDGAESGTQYTYSQINEYLLPHLPIEQVKKMTNALLDANTDKGPLLNRTEKGEWILTINPDSSIAEEYEFYAGLTDQDTLESTMILTKKSTKMGDFQLNSAITLEILSVTQGKVGEAISYQDLVDKLQNKYPEELKEVDAKELRRAILAVVSKDPHNRFEKVTERKGVQIDILGIRQVKEIQKLFIAEDTPQADQLRYYFEEGKLDLKTAYRFRLYELWLASREKGGERWFSRSRCHQIAQEVAEKLGDEEFIRLNRKIQLKKIIQWADGNKAFTRSTELMQDIGITAPDATKIAQILEILDGIVVDYQSLISNPEDLIARYTDYDKRGGKLSFTEIMSEERRGPAIKSALLAVTHELLNSSEE